MIAADKILPNPALKSLEKLVGTWKVSGEAQGQVTFCWMEGGFFLVQYVDLEDTHGIEFIGYDEKSGTVRSHYFDNSGKTLEYTYKVTQTEHVVAIDMPGLQGGFKGRFSNNHTMITGSWKWKKDGRQMRYNAVLTKAY